MLIVYYLVSWLINRGHYCFHWVHCSRCSNFYVWFFSQWDPRQEVFIFLEEDGFFSALQPALTWVRIDMKLVALDLSQVNWQPPHPTPLPPFPPQWFSCLTLALLAFCCVPLCLQLTASVGLMAMRPDDICASGKAVAAPVTPGLPGELLITTQLLLGERHTLAAPCACSRSVRRTNSFLHGWQSDMGEGTTP